MKQDSGATVLAALGVVLLAVAASLASARAWAYGAKAALAAVVGLSYLLVGAAARSSDSVPQALRRVVLAGPAAYVALFGALQAVTVLAHGSTDLSVDAVVRALWATLLGYPVGLGFLYARSSTRATSGRLVATAAASVLAGAAVGSVAWPSVWPSSVGLRFGLLLAGGGALVFAGGVPPYLVASWTSRTGET